MLGTVPTISVNKTEGCQIYLSKDALSCDIISAKSSEMNVLIPGGDDYVSVWHEAAELQMETTERALVFVLDAALQPSPRFVLQREFPVPEQFKTVWDGTKLVTEPTEIAG